MLRSWKTKVEVPSLMESFEPFLTISSGNALSHGVEKYSVKERSQFCLWNCSISHLNDGMFNVKYKAWLASCPYPE